MTSLAIEVTPPTEKKNSILAKKCYEVTLIVNEKIRV